MRDYGSFFSSVFLLLTHSIGASAQDQSRSGIERQKEMIVSRIAQATDVAQQRCSTTAAAPNHARIYERFRARYPELISLVEHSPYFAPSRDYFQTLLATDGLPRMNEQDLLHECQSLEYMLRALMDAPGGNRGGRGIRRITKEIAFENRAGRTSPT